MPTVISIDKIIWAMFGYQSKDGNYIYGAKPKFHTVHGVIIDDTGFAYPHHDYPFETCLERAKRLDILDIWIPTIFIRMQGGVRLTIQGARALSIWKTYSSKQFGAATHHENKRRNKSKTKENR